METPDRRVSFQGTLVQRQDGTVLVVVLLLIAIMLSLGLFGSGGAQVELQIAHNELTDQQALYAAEAGLSHASKLMNGAAGGNFTTELSSGGTGGTLTTLGSVVAIDGKNYRFRAFGGGVSDGYYVRAEDNYDESAGADDPATDVDSTVKIISRGRVRGAERILEAFINNATLYPWGMFGKTFVNISGGSSAFTDSYNSNVGSYATTPHGNNGHVASNGAISLSGATIHGDVTAHGTVSGGSGVTGTTTPNAPTMNLKLDPVPACGPPYSSAAGLSGVYAYDPTKGKLTVSGGNNLTLANGTYCFSSVTLSGGSTMTVNGPVVVNVTAACNFSGGGISNTTGNPLNMQIFSSLVALGNKNGVVVSGGSNAYFTVYAPNTGVTISGGSSIYGSLIAGNITSSGGSQIHYDDALAAGGANGGQLTGWHEVRNW